VRLDHVADRLVSDLSHGQQRQLEIGMALAGAPRFILFDEPAAGLSPAERRELVQILGALPPHIGFIIIEHDLDVALRVAERVTVMHNGHVLKHGTPGEIESDAAVQAIYIGGGRHWCAAGSPARGERAARRRSSSSSGSTSTTAAPTPSRRSP
jgi:branched-chain amino acid transport system ATP-binding protein